MTSLVARMPISLPDGRDIRPGETFAVVDELAKTLIDAGKAERVRDFRLPSARSPGDEAK